MTKIRVFPHEELCPEGKEIDAESGEILAEVLLQNQIKIEHACELSCACTTCHVIVRKGFESLGEASDDEEDMLDKAWGLESESRLSCQVEITDTDLDVELPKYTINMVSGESLMLWTDVNDIAVELFEKFPDLDPTYILFTDLREMIMNLENFEDDPDRSNEKILEAIQMLWLEERE